MVSQIDGIERIFQRCQRGESRLRLQLTFPDGDTVPSQGCKRDEVLFVSPETHKTEPELPFPLRNIFRERLRLGTPELIWELQIQGYEVWIYTSSFRSEGYIRRLFRCYGVRLDGIVNGNRHLREVQRDSKTVLPQKLPSRYRISLHIDDEAVICTAAGQYGFRAYQLDTRDDDKWKEKIIEQAARIRQIEHFDEPEE